MKKVVTYYDRCGKPFDKWNHDEKEHIGIVDLTYEDDEPFVDCSHQKDLCRPCYNELENWWNRGSQSEREDNK